MTESVDPAGGAFWADDGDESARSYRELVNAVGDGLYRLDADGRIVGANDALVALTGYDRDRLHGAAVSTLLCDRGRIEAELADGGEATVSSGIVTADGSAVPCEIRITDTGDGEVGVVRELPAGDGRTPPASIANVIDEADVGVFVLDEEFEVAWADETVEEYFGVGSDSVVGRQMRTVVDEILADRVADPERFAERVLATYGENGAVEQFECRVTAGPDREERWLEHYSKPIEAGEYAGGRIEIYYDITDRKESEGSLRDAEERFESLVDAVEEYAIFRLDTDGTVISWNEGAREIKGYDADEIVGDHFSTFYTESDREADVPERNLEAALTEGSIEDEGWRVRADGSRFWANVTITAVFDDDGTHRGFLKVTRDMTDRHRRERELESELERLLGRISDAFYAVDEAFRFTHVNERAEQLLGYSAEELEGTIMWRVFPDSSARLYEQFESALAEQEPASFERYFESLDLWAEVNVYPSETGLSVYLLDVTERKRREQELRRTERRFEAVFQDPNILVGLLDPDGTVRDINQTAMEYIDADLADVRGEPFWETPWWGESDGARADAREWTQRAAAGEYVDFEADLVDPNGERYTISGVFRPVVDDGEVVSIIVSDRDVTERKRRERQLAKSEQRYRTLAESFPNGLVTLFDDDLRYELAAGQAFEWLPHDPEAIEGCHVGEVWPDETFETLRPAFESALDGESESVELSYAGREWILRLVPVTDESGDVFAAMTMAQDITERKERERRLEESNERLEQFAYAASHDLQEPLRMVSSYLQLLESRYGDELDEDGREFLEFAVDGAERMKAMIDGLLDYSRVESRGNPLEPTDLNAVLEDVRTDLQFRIEESDAEITADELPTVEGDEGQLRQLVQNLLENAIEYSGDEPPEIHVSAERAGNRWRIDVRDAGIGIDADDRDRVFEVFQRLHAREEHDGTGIGLALCKRIVERHGGEIWVEPTPGGGATFSFTLPAVGD